MMFTDLVGRRVLVVEDDYMQASDLVLALEHQGSDVVGPFPDLEGGLYALENSLIEAAVLDIRLGEEDVFILADRLRSRDVPFMFVSGYDRDRIPERFREVRYVQKPVDLEEMTIALAIVVAERRTTH